VTIDFESEKRKRDDDPNRVRCAHCGQWIFSRSKRCPKCGVFFRGEAFQFTHADDELHDERLRRRRRGLVAVAVLVTILVVSVTLFFRL
jgi:uncharacterized membrane protein YvbJ